MKRLIVCEKPSVAQAISRVLAKGQPVKRSEGFVSFGDTAVSWCYGHLLELAAPDAYDSRYARWDYEDLPILPGEWQYNVLKDKAAQLAVLSRLLADAETIICATDAGREGELIFRRVYHYCNCKKPFKRLWISSMEESAIEQGFAQLQDGARYDNLYQAALCRARADWLVGMNASRLFTLFSGQTLSVGRVQTPTLALIAERERAIAGFKKQKSYSVSLDLGGFTAESGQAASKKEAEGWRAACSGPAFVTEITQKEKAILPPRLYDLTTLQRDANRLLGFTAQQTLDCAQALYEKKLVTYPRTDSQYLTEDMREKIPGLAQMTAGKLPFFGDVTAVDAARVVDSSKVSDHHALIPTAALRDADLDALPTGEKSILYLTGARLLCAVGEPHTYRETVATLDCAGRGFTAKGKRVVCNGWKETEEKLKAWAGIRSDETDGFLPDLQEGQRLEQAAASVKEHVSSPPKHLTEDLLLSAMERAGTDDFGELADTADGPSFGGLGTPATRAATIEKLIRAGFLRRKEKRLVPTDKGYALIDALPEAVKSPRLTAEWEAKLAQVEHGALSSDAFMAGIAEMVGALVRSYPVAAQVVGSCPRCGADVVVEHNRYACKNRECSFSLWPRDRFFVSKRAELTPEIAAALLRDGKVYYTGLYSEKKKKTYDAFVILEDTGKYVNFKLDFGGKQA